MVGIVIEVVLISVVGKEFLAIADVAEGSDFADRTVVIVGESAVGGVTRGRMIHTGHGGPFQSTVFENVPGSAHHHCVRGSVLGPVPVVQHLFGDGLAVVPQDFLPFTKNNGPWPDALTTVHGKTPQTCIGKGAGLDSQVVLPEEVHPAEGFANNAYVSALVPVVVDVGTSMAVQILAEFEVVGFVEAKLVRHGSLYMCGEKSPDFKKKSPDFPKKSPDLKKKSPDLKKKSADFPKKSPDFFFKSKTYPPSTIPVALCRPE